MPTLPQRSVRLSILQVTTLLALGAPPLLVHLCDWIASCSDKPMEQDLVCAEYFSGVASIVHEFRARGSPAQGFDINNEEVVQNLLGNMGFIYALTLALRIQKGGLMALGLPCNSHSFMSYAVHQRSAWMMHGNEQQPLVVDGNCLAYRSTLLILVAIARSVQWAVENPSGSKCLLLPIFHKLTYDYGPLIRSTTCKWWMGAFGSWSCKPELGFGNASFLMSLKEPLTKEMSGDKKHMSSSAAYPRLYGSHVAQHHLDSMAGGGVLQDLPDLGSLVLDGFHDIADGDWARADLQPLDLLQEAVMQGKFHPDPLVPMQIQPSREVFERVKLHWLQSQNNGN